VTTRRRVDDDGRRDFDFLFGEWRVLNRSLVGRLCGSTEWVEFETIADARPILQGLGNVDRIVREGEDGWEGATVRLFDPASGEWRIYWACTKQPGRLDRPLTGRFSDGRGEFHGDDTFEGRPIRVRFYWKDITATAAVWEQAFSADAGESWETNWIMSFTRRQDA
jgi:hypothetical protein